ncbi:hypothetical protein KFE98_20030 [bacterium SCSIO 12741]|nr:hypothetical protein KFE98_20030 [bacterium SCSIO 12741]
MQEDKAIAWYFRQGLTRDTRLIKALMPDTVKVGGWTAGALTNFCSQYAKLLWYFNQNDQHDGDWTELLVNDPSIFLSRIYRTNLDLIGNQRMELFEAVLESSDDDDRRKAVLASLQFMMDLANQLQDWSQQALELNLPELSFELDNATNNRLKASFSKLMAWIAECSGDTTESTVGSLMTPVIEHDWGMTTQDLLDSISQDSSELLKNATPDIIKSLNNLFDSFYQVYVYIVNLIPEMVERSIEDNSNHKPHIALLFSFIELYLRLQDEQNKLSERHLNYYYQTLLDQQIQPGTADRVFLSLPLRKGAPPTWVPKGTLLAAGKDAQGQDVEFATLTDLLVNHAEITDIRTLILATNTFIEPLYSEGMTTSIYGAIVQPKEVDPAEGWAPFGENYHLRSSMAGVNPQSDLGWVLSAPVLRLETGIRKVQILLKFNPASFQKMDQKISQMVKDSRSSEAFLVSHFFASTFDLSYTSGKVWESIPVYRMGLPQEVPNTLSIEFILSASSAPLTRFAGKPTTVYEESEHPSIKLMLNQKSVYNPYSLICDLVLDQVQINVEVEQVDKLNLYNDLGKIVTGSPFSVFGVNAQIESSFYFGYPELFAKKLNSLNLKFQWMNLPETAGGLTKYYENYGLGITDESFQVDISVLSNYSWEPERNIRQRFPLFATYRSKDQTFLSRDTEMTSLDLDLLRYNYLDNLTDQEVYNSLQQSGFFKLSLCAPMEAFGSEKYPEILTRIAMENIQNKGKQPPVVLSKPFEPKASGFSLSYSAEQTIEVAPGVGMKSGYNSRASLYHIHPFGNHQVFSNGVSENDFWFPHYNGKGYLFLGLEKLQPGEAVNIYLEIASVPSSIAGTPPLVIQWQYLTDDRWMDLHPDHLLMDGTRGFQNSGVIQLQLPRDISFNNSLMPHEKYWFRAVLVDETKPVGNVLYVSTQGIEAIRQGSITSKEPPVLPAGKITQPVQKFPNLDSLVQPFSSFGGGGAETDQEYYVRVSEVLGHKNRAITRRDFERLILQEFQEIYNVRCVTPTQCPGWLKPGEIVIMVVPKVLEPTNLSQFQASSFELDAIKRFIQPLAAPNLNITVRNPLYEELLIKCNICFTESGSDGHFLELLNQAIREFVSPWMVDQSAVPQTNQGIQKDVLLGLIQRQEYVKYVTSFSVIQIFPKEENLYGYYDTAAKNIDYAEIRPSAPWAVLVASNQHQIEVISQEKYEEPSPLSISDMTIGADFIIGSHPEKPPLIRSGAQGATDPKKNYVLVLDKNF